MIKKEIADKLFKTQLAEQKVELSKVDDINRDFKELNGIMNDLESLFKEVSRKVGRARTLANTVSDEGTKTQKQLDELGITDVSVRAETAYANNAKKSLANYNTPKLF
jgi:hypothetical protein